MSEGWGDSLAHPHLSQAAVGDGGGKGHPLPSHQRSCLKRVNGWCEAGSPGVWLQPTAHAPA